MRRIVLVLALAVALPVAALFVATRGLPDLEMRPAAGTPGAWIGSLADGSLPKQRFRARSDGLWRIDVALRRNRHAGDIRLNLLDGDEVVRSAVGRDGTVRDLNYAFTTFEFEPVEDSGGRELAFELEPGEPVQKSWAPRLRPRRLAGSRPLLKGKAVRAETARGRFLSSRDQLTALSFFATTVKPGVYRLLLSETSGEVVREVRHRIATAYRGGTLWIPFEPITGSREHVYNWTLAPAPGTELMLQELEFGETQVLTTSPGQYHGALRDDPYLLGASGLAWPANEADLLFATFAHGRDPWADLAGRMGPRLPAAGALWIGACLTLALALRRRRDTSGDPAREPDPSAT